MLRTRRTYKYRLYTHKRNRHLHEQINVAGVIFNHCVALQRRYYRMFGGYIGKTRLQSHIARLRRNNPEWQKLGSQAVQQIVERLDNAYQRFFKWVKTRQPPRYSPPRFKKVSKYSSFTLKQAGWKLLEGNQIKIGDVVYRFVKSREMEGQIKTVTVKRNSLGKMYVCFSLVQEQPQPKRATTGKIGGFDFGLKTFLVDHEDGEYLSPQFLKAELANLRQASRKLSSKRKGSNNRRKARVNLALKHETVSNKRRDSHFKLSHRLLDNFDVLVFEDLHIRAMQRLWGRKVSDLGFADFVSILEHLAAKRGKRVLKTDCFEPTSQVCSECENRQPIPLRQRTFECGSCGLVLDRDHNAARNIYRVGASTLGLDGVKLPCLSGRQAPLGATIA